MNTAGMRGIQRRRQILHNMWNSDNDIILLQETHISSDINKETEKLWPGTILFSPGKENTGGDGNMLPRQKHDRKQHHNRQKRKLSNTRRGTKRTQNYTDKRLRPIRRSIQNTKRQKKSMDDPTKHTYRQINTGQHTHTRRRLQHDGRQIRQNYPKRIPTNLPISNLPNRTQKHTKTRRLVPKTKPIG